MINFMRELFNSDLCEVSMYHKCSEECQSAKNRQDSIYEKLTSRFDEESRALFEEYAETETAVRNEELFHAYCCGMRDLLRMYITLFDEQ